jgi:MinD-like ATPase involved in chromosome partitioning or flagellar assembly
MTSGTEEPPRNGKIVTFYSYKGGTGRSMALANVAWILANGGNRVLTIDWDLEAPDCIVISSLTSTIPAWKAPRA